MGCRLAGTVAALLVLLAMTACTSATSTAPHGGHRSASPAIAASRPSARWVSARQVAAIRRTTHCGRHIPQPAGAAPARAGRAPAIGPRPAVAMICEYEYWPDQHNRPARLAGQATLGPWAASGLAAVVDTAAATQPYMGSCGGDLPTHAHAVVILFGYPVSRVVSATVHQPSCGDVGNLTAGGRSFRLPWPVFSALMAPSADSAGNSGPRAPGLTGLSLAAATAAARRRGLAIQLSGVVTDPAAPIGSVLYQAVPPGAPSRRRDGPAVRVIVAVRPAPACTPGQLRLTYRGNGHRRGTDWGAIVISDAGKAPCRLPMSARITGLDQAGRPMGSPYTASTRGISSYSDPTSAPLILSPRMGAIPDGLAAPYGFPPPPGGLAGAISLAGGGYGATRAGARSCQVIRAWRVEIGGLSRTVPNADPAGPDPLVPSGAFVTCEARLSPALSYYGLLTY